MTERREGRGQILIRGKIDREASITVDGNPVQQDAEGFFQAWKNTSSGTNTFNVTADDGTDITNQNYQFTRANTGAVNINYQYDDNGNLRFEKLNNGNTLKEYLWDAENRLITIRQWEPATSDTLTTPTKESRFTYDAMDRRIRKIEYENGSEVLRRHYLWVGSEIAEKRGSNSSTEVIKYFPQGYEDELANDFFYYTRDHLGSIREVIAEDGVTVLARYDYDPYGNVTALSGSLSDSDFLYTGHYYHQPTGLHLAQYRAYDAKTGRWISRDPIEEGDGPNLYAYVGNRFINAIDPLGLKQCCVEEAYKVAFLARDAYGTALVDAYGDDVYDIIAIGNDAISIPNAVKGGTGKIVRKTMEKTTEGVGGTGGNKSRTKGAISLIARLGLKDTARKLQSAIKDWQECVKNAKSDCEFCEANRYIDSARKDVKKVLQLLRK